MPSAAFLVLAMLLGLSPFGEARAPTSDDFTSLWKDGIGSTVAVSIQQDPTGFLWVGTQGALVRYDGYDFVAFRSDPDDPASLDDSFVSTVFVDDDGAVWAGTLAGVCRYEPDTGGFVRYAKPATDTEEERRLAVTAVVEYGGRYLVGAELGLFQIDLESREIRPYPAEPSGNRLGWVEWLLVGSDGTLWVGGADGLASQARPDAPIERRRAPDGDTTVETLFEDRTGQVWIFWSDGAVELVRPGGEIRPLRAPSKELASLVAEVVIQPNDQEIWVGTKNGIVVLDASTGKDLHTVPFETGVYALSIDRSGVVWVGVAGEGLKRHVPVSSAFQLKRDGLAVSSVNAAAEVDGRIWIGTRGGGIYVWSPEDDALRHIDITPLTEPPNAGFVRDILAWGDSVWVATNQAAVIRFDRDGNHRESLGVADGLPAPWTITLEPLSTDEILVGTTDGLGLIDTRGSKATAGFAPFFNEDPETWQPSPIIDIVVRDGMVYAGGEDGLWEVSPDGTSKRQFTYDAAVPDSLSHNGVVSLLLDSRRRLWVGTRGGLNLLEPDAEGKSRFRRFGLADGLKDPFVDGLLEGADGGIWAATGTGLSRVDPDTFSIEVYDQDDGVPDTSFWVGSHESTHDGTMMFAAKRGLLLVDPEITPWTYDPRLAVTAVRVDGMARQPGASHRELTLAADERDFAVEFAALDLSNPDANRYSVRLEGYDDKWVDTDAAHRVATYTNLDPGAYTLRVRGTNRVGRWSPDEIALPVEIRPAIVETAAFRILAAFSLIGLLFLLYGWRTRHLAAREAELQRLVQKRTAELEEANRQLARSSLTDFLTGLPNRRGFAEAAEAEIKRWRRSPRPLCIALCDFDNFKALNDAHGHDAGDFVLRSFARLLGEHLRESDVVARWGGEEFILLLPETDLAGGRTVVEKITRRVADTPWEYQARKLNVTVTVGISQLVDESDLNDCITRADAALYRGKKEGKSRVVAAR